MAAVSKELKNRILCRGGESYDLMQLERIVRENVAATAEGAVAEAVQNSPVTLRGSLCILTGYGRCGSAIHQCLKNWGCTIVVYDLMRTHANVQKKQERRSVNIRIFQKY